MNSTSLFKGFALVLFSVLVWSGWMVVSRFAVKGTLTPFDVTAIRFSIAGLLLLPVVIKRGLAIGPYGKRGAFLLAFLVGAPYTTTAVAGMMFAPASHASTVINGTFLVLTTLVGIRVLKEPTTPLRLFGVACSLGGIGCMLVAHNDYSGPNQWVGHVLFAVAGAMWGSYSVLVRAWRADATHAAAVVCVFSMLCYLPLYALFAHSHIGWQNWREVAFQAVYQGVLTGVLAFITFNTGLHILGASRAGAVVPLIPALATLLAIPVLGEVPSLLECSGVGAVCAGVFLGSGMLKVRPEWLLQREVGD